ncbi:MAG: FAD-dependent oxidoreductase [Clostridia bacterium]|nr:FAD-dependent oxidoreductase [Clostridia bacterium]
MRKFSVFALVFGLILSIQSLVLAESYTASAQGFGGEVTVTLTITDGKLTNVTATGDGETDGVGSRAIEDMPAMMMETNSVEVDGITGATVTSTAVLEAAGAALAQSGVKLTAVEQQAASAMTPGTYTATSTGFHGPVTVSVEVSEDSIVSVKVTGEQETPMVGEAALSILAESIVENQTTTDTVSGATFSSNGMNAAVEDALLQAGANSASIASFRKNTVPAEKCEDTETDIVVVGAGTAGMVAAMNACDQGAKVILLEKTGITGGSASLSHGTIWALHIPETTADGMYDYNADDVYELFNKLAYPVLNKDVLYTIAGNTTRGIEYLQKNGYTIGMLDKSQEKFAPYINAMTHEDMGYGFTAMLDKNIRERNIDLRLNTSAISLKMNENGQVSGVVAENEAGQYTISAQKVIYA